MYAYIDESGDPGTNRKGSRWLVFGCAMVADSDVSKMEPDVQAVRNQANPQSGKHLHFRDLPHDDKVGALNLMAGMPWTGVIVASDTTRTPIHDPQLLYAATAGYVIEKVFAYAGYLNETASIFFESSGNLHLEELDSLVQLASLSQTMLTREQSATGTNAIPPYRIQEMAKGGTHGLDLADGLAHAAFRALEPNRKWGHFEPSYLNILKPRLWRGPTNTGSEGWELTLMPTEMAGRFREEHPWLP